jgi:ureidoglycolate dehydrogenase (NAD+)
MEVKIKFEELQSFVFSILEKVGLDEFSKDAVGKGLTETSLRGVDSHGVRLLSHYVNSALTGRKNPKPKFKFENNFPTIFCLDADNGFGHAAGMAAIDKAMIAANEYGVGIVGVTNSSHPGAMASMALKAARKGFIAFAFTHADALTLSHEGSRPYFGTNPICFAAPRQEEEPFCLDMATSVAPWNKVKLAITEGQTLEPGIAADEYGMSTEDPAKAKAVFPTGGYKGVGLASMVETLCSIFTGMNFGRSIPAMFTTPMEEQRKLGQFYMVIKADGIVAQESFVKNLQAMTEEFREEPALPGKKVLLAGDKEILTSKDRIQNGVPLDSATLEAFKELSKKYEVHLNLI